MKRKLALLLAGCLAISPAAAGYYPAQALAAETDAGSESGDPVPAKISVSVKDENETVLSAISSDAGQEEDAAKYSMSVGETRQLTALTPEIIDIDDDGFITAKSAGAGLISLSISSDISQNPTEFKYEILVLEPEIKVSEEITTVTEDSASAPEGTTDEAKAAIEEPAAAAVADDETAAEPTAETADSTEATISGDPAPAPEAEPDAAAAEPEAAETAESEAAAAPEADPAAETADSAAATVSGDPIAAPDLEPEAEAADSVTESVSGDPAATAAADPTETITASVAMNAAVETGNTSSKVNTNQGKLVTPHWEGSYSTGWRYIRNDGSKATGKMTIDGKIYIFNSAGELCTGWIFLILPEKCAPDGPITGMPGTISSAAERRKRAGIKKAEHGITSRATAP